MTKDPDSRTMSEAVEQLRRAALAVCDRWDSPDWKDQRHTGDFIRELRRAAALTGEAEPVGWREALPDLTAVIHWLSSGCDPAHAVTELHIYQKRILDFLSALRGEECRLPALTGEAEPGACPACDRGEVFGLSTDDGFWVEMGASAGGAHEHGMNGWLELIEHNPAGTEKRREYVATDSPLYTRPQPVAWPEGFKLVPVEPTEAMLDSVLGTHTCVSRHAGRIIYGAMLRAAPALSASGGGE